MKFLPSTLAIAVVFAAPVHVVGARLRATFPENVGRLRGELVEDGRAIHAFWIRPGVTEDWLPRRSRGWTTSIGLPTASRI